MVVRQLVLAVAGSVLLVGCGFNGHFEERFEREDWYERWGLEEAPEHCDTVPSDDVPSVSVPGDDVPNAGEGREAAFGPAQPSGRVLRVRIPKDDHYGVGKLAYYFREHGAGEPSEAYLGYDLQLGLGWHTVVSGKLPGIAGTYDHGGWGGRRSDGLNGWSARGMFTPTVDGVVPIGSYCYHVDQRRIYGSSWVWDLHPAAKLVPGRWYRIEQYCRLNTPGQHDGVVRAWVDGNLVFEKTDIRFRDTPELRIETIWMDVYHGGKAAAPIDLQLYIDDVVIARQRPGEVPLGP